MSMNITVRTSDGMIGVLISFAHIGRFIKFSGQIGVFAVFAWLSSKTGAFYFFTCCLPRCLVF